MTGWKTISSILAKESNYRLKKKHGRKLTRFSTTNVVKSNFLGIVVMSGVSVVIIFPVLVDVQTHQAIPFFVGILGLLELFIGAFAMAYNLHVLLEDRLLEPLRFLPIEEDVVRKALLGIVVYWGGLSYTFTLLTPSLLLALKFGMQFLAWGFFASITILLLSTGIGYFAGSLYTKYSKSIAARLASLVMWILIFGFGLIFRFIPKEGNFETTTFFLLIPPFSFGYAMLGYPTAYASSMLTFIASLLIYKYSSGRFWKVLSYGLVDSKAIYRRDWHVGFSRSYFIKKDLKLFSRNPKLLASTLYFLIVGPFVVLLSLLRAENLFSPLLPALSLFAAGVSGPSVAYAYAIEGSGAKLLYFLPLPRKILVREKATLILLFTLPIAILISFAVIVANPIIGVVTGATYFFTSYGSLLINSRLIASKLPKEPASWTEKLPSQSFALAIFFGEFILFGFLAGLALTPYVIKLGLRNLMAGNLPLLPEALAVPLIVSIGVLILGLLITSFLEEKVGG